MPRGSGALTALAATLRVAGSVVSALFRLIFPRSAKSVAAIEAENTALRTELARLKEQGFRFRLTTSEKLKLIYAYSMSDVRDEDITVVKPQVLHRWCRKVLGPDWESKRKSRRRPDGSRLGKTT